MPIGQTAPDEFTLQLFQYGYLLLSHRLTQLIRFTSGKVGQQTAQQHDLLLIHSNAIGILEVLLHLRMS